MIKKYIVIIQIAHLLLLNVSAHAQVKSRFDKKHTSITEMILSTSDEKELEKLSFERLKERAEKREELVNVVEL
jgi:hypothetical protein